MIRLVRKNEAWRRHSPVEWSPELWALDTPVSRMALERLVAIGNAAYGHGTHWIEERDLGEASPLIGGTPH